MRQHLNARKLTYLFYFIPLFQWPGLPLELVETARHPDIKHSKALETSRTFSAINLLTFSLQPWPIHPKHRLRSNFSQLSMGKALERGGEVARSVAFVSVRNKPLVGVTKFKVVKPQLISWGLWWFCVLAVNEVAGGKGSLGWVCWWSRLIYSDRMQQVYGKRVL